MQRLTPNNTQTMQGTSKGVLRAQLRLARGSSSPRSCLTPPSKASPELKPDGQRRMQKGLEPSQPLSYKETSSSSVSSHQARPPL